MTLKIGALSLDSAVALAPMAGVTNIAFRTLCREQELERTGTVSGLYICEMITARALVHRNEKTLHMTTFGPHEDVRSLQLYTVDPEYTFKAAKMIADEGIADHIDMNFGCPVPKVTKRGGGSALPYKRRLFGNIVAAAVKGVEGTNIPVTVKFRMGIDQDHLTHLDAGRIAAEEGAAAVTLHARTAAERYSGDAHWDEIGKLKEHLAHTNVPVLGNGDIFKPTDAVDMIEASGCDGVVVGRGCLGRPWLFAGLSAVMRGEEIPLSPPWEKSLASSIATQSSSSSMKAKPRAVVICVSTWDGIYEDSLWEGNSEERCPASAHSPSSKRLWHRGQILKLWRKTQIVHAVDRGHRLRYRFPTAGLTIRRTRPCPKALKSCTRGIGASYPAALAF